MNWQHKDEWKRTGDGFTIVVSRHSVPETEFNIGEGLQRWCVYAYIYPSHPYFSEIDQSGPMYQDALCSMPLHGGPSLFKVHQDEEGDVCSVQVGGDYNHLCDDNYTRMETKDDAYSVFNDADELFNWLEAV